MKALFNKFHRRINLVALLLSNSGSGNKTTYSEFINLKIVRVFSYIVWSLKVPYVKFAIHSRYFFGRTGWIRAVEDRPQKFWANFFRFGRVSFIAQPKNLLIWGNFVQIERNSPEIFGAKLICADSPISGEKNNYCVCGKYSRARLAHQIFFYWIQWKSDPISFLNMYPKY
jgi:hypothetical protein